MLNILSVDVEDYHDQLALDFQGRIVPPDEEAIRSTERLLDLFAEYNVKATFFILGEIAQYFPALVRKISDEGHHLGIHGYHHHLVFRLSEREFRSSIDRAKKTVEDTTGRSADAYRATAFSINKTTPWAFPALIDLGFKYDSSVYPFKGRRYGDPLAPRGPYRHELPDGRWIWEIPLSTVMRWGRRWPVCGGGYLRLFPLTVSEQAIRTINGEGLPAVIYLHPYETEVEPAVRVLPGLTLWERLHFEFFNYHQKIGRRGTIRKLRHLLAQFRFGTIEQYMAAGYAEQEKICC